MPSLLLPGRPNSVECSEFSTDELISITSTHIGRSDLRSSCFRELFRRAPFSRVSIELASAILESSCQSAHLEVLLCLCSALHHGYGTDGSDQDATDRLISALSQSLSPVFRPLCLLARSGLGDHLAKFECEAIMKCGTGETIEEYDSEDERVLNLRLLSMTRWAAAAVVSNERPLPRVY